MKINSIFSNNTIYVNFNWINDDEWHYECIDMYSYYNRYYNNPKSALTLTYVLFIKIRI